MKNSIQKRVWQRKNQESVGWRALNVVDAQKGKSCRIPFYNEAWKKHGEEIITMLSKVSQQEALGLLNSYFIWSNTCRTSESFWSFLGLWKGYYIKQKKVYSRNYSTRGQKPYNINSNLLYTPALKSKKRESSRIIILDEITAKQNW